MLDHQNLYSLARSIVPEKYRPSSDVDWLVRETKKKINTISPLSEKNVEKLMREIWSKRIQEENTLVINCFRNYGTRKNCCQINKNTHQEIRRIVKTRLTQLARYPISSQILDDIVSDVSVGFLKKCRKMDSVLIDNNTDYTISYQKYIAGIARHKCIDYLKKHNPQNLLLSLEKNQHKFYEMVAKEIEEDYDQEKANNLKRYIRSMNKRCRELLEFHYLEGWSTPVIAERLDKKVGTVKKGLHDCRNKVRKIFNVKKKK